MSTTELVVSDGEELRAPALGLQHIVSVAPTLTIDSESDLELAAELLAQVTKALKDIDAQRKHVTQPLLEAKRRLDQMAKDAGKGLLETSALLRGLIRDYHDAQGKARAELAAAAQASSGQRVTDPGLLPMAPEEKVETSAGAVTMRKRWTFEVEDLNRLIMAAADDPALRLYLMLAPSEVTAAVKQGTRHIPGLRIYETKDPVVR